MINIKDKKSLESAFAQDFATPYFPVLADLYLHEGDLRRAKLVCEVGLQHNEENNCGKYVLAKVFLAENKPALAEKWLKQVINDNPSNFNAIRMLIHVEFTLNRSPKTIKRYIQKISDFVPNDPECLAWLSDIGEKKTDLVIKQKTEQNIDDIPQNKPKIKDTTKKNVSYNLEESMATFTMLQVFKAQKHYHQALEVLNMLESKNMDPERIEKEKEELQSLINQETVN